MQTPAAPKEPVPAPDTPQQRAQPAQQAEAATAAPVAFFITQQEEEEGFIELRLADGSLWAWPDAVLSRADLDSVEPRRTQGGQAFVRFGLNAEGSSKLALLVQDHADELLVVAVGEEVVGLTRVSQPDPGQLDVAMGSDEMAIAVADAIAGAPESQGPANIPAD